ncbi:MAG: hypothetical protein RLZZ393_1466 [Pseudomonadota bacterium]|jgi:small-conductance mechanosensitive channel
MPDPNALLQDLATAHGLSQFVGIALAVLAAIATGHLARVALRRNARREGGGAAALDGLLLAVAPATAALVLLATTVTLQALSALPSPWAGLALNAAITLLAVRLGVFVVSLAFGRDNWLRRHEHTITFLLWVVTSGWIQGWLGFVEDTLDAIDLMPGKARFSLWGLLKSVVVVTVFVLVSSLVSRSVERRVMKLESLALSTRLGITKFTYFFLITLGVLIGVNAAGVDLTALTVLTGAVGIGLGFGLQAIASNFVSGFVLLMDKSIKPGDVISFTGTTGTSTENFGWVQELRGRYVVVRDRDGVETLVPNQNLITTPVINWSYSDRKVRLKLPVRISYADDPELALSVLLEAAKCSPRVLRDPEPVSRLMHFSDHGIDLELRFWIADPQNGVNNVRSDVNRAIWKQFKSSGITIPVAQHDVRMVGTRGGGA